MEPEIMFRGKRIDNGKWAYGFYVNCRGPNDPPNHTRHYIVEYPDKYHEIYTSTTGWYTGLKDRNGERIFKGDIVITSDDIGVETGLVKYGRYKNLINDDGYHIGPYIDWRENEVLRKELAFWVEEGLEVIGNIHDNPDLLKQRIK